MNELLQKLLEAEILSVDTKKQLEAAFATQLAEAVDATKKATAEQVEVELKEQWITERDALIEAIDTKVDTYLETEMSELREDINRFRDLEAEYAEKLVEAKAELAVELQSDLTELVEKLDAFLEIRLEEEFEELREDIEEVKKAEFGRKIFEGFVSEFKKNFVDEDSVEAELAEARAQLEDTLSALKEAETQTAKLVREAKLEDILSPLSGRQRDVMEAILKNVATAQLEEGYKTFIGRVLKEDAKEEKETTVLAEDANSTEKNKKKIKGVIVSGDTDETLTEGEEVVKPTMSEKDKAALRRLAGIE